MGREVKRLALDFSWPKHKTWGGYLMPEYLYSVPCEHCDQSGLNPESKKISDDWYTHLRTDGQKGWSEHLEQEDVDALIAADRLIDFTSVFCTSESPGPIMTKQAMIDSEGSAGKYFDSWLENGAIVQLEDTHRGEPLYMQVRGWRKRDDGYHPTAAEVNEWSRHGLGHDSINQWIASEARAKRLGVWGHCEYCNGEGHTFRDSHHKKAHEEWEPTEPPAGEGWQLWETVSEGSPVSPVFAAKEELSEWLQIHGDGNSGPYSKEVADAFVDAGWAPSLIMTNGEVKPGAAIYTEK